jgi:hypothetical protein
MRELFREAEIRGHTEIARLLRGYGAGRHASFAAAFRPASLRGILAGMGKRPQSPVGDPMTLANMRANGVRSLDGHAGSATTGRS